jgi:hypothetical protein
VLNLQKPQREAPYGAWQARRANLNAGAGIAWFTRRELPASLAGRVRKTELPEALSIRKQARFRRLSQLDNDRRTWRGPASSECNEPVSGILVRAKRPTLLVPADVGARFRPGRTLLARGIAALGIHVS